MNGMTVESFPQFLGEGQTKFKLKDSIVRMLIRSFTPAISIDTDDAGRALIPSV